MRFFIVFEKERHALDITEGETVADTLDYLQKKLRMNFTADTQQKKYLTLEIQGSELKNDWVLTDLGFEPGTTFKCYLKQEEQPSLRIHLTFSGDTIPIFDEVNFYRTPISDIRTTIQNHTGIPVSAFKLVAQKNKKRLYDGMTLYDYDLQHGDLICMETWDGWGPLLHASLMDLPHKVYKFLTSEEDPMIARFQARVSLAIAAHFGLLDLASKLVIGMGVRPDEAIGSHPATQWCFGGNTHPETLKAPIHVAAERDQLAFLKLIIAHNVTYCVARDGRQLTALSVALRSNNRKSASLLITKAWSKQPPAAEIAFPLPIYTKLKKWCEIAKDEIYLTYSGDKSSGGKTRRWYQRNKMNVNLVGQPILLEGFSEDIMQSKMTRPKTIKSYDFNLRASTAQPRTRLPTIRIETPPLVRREQLKYQAKKAGIPQGDIPNIIEAALFDLRKPASEPKPSMLRRKSRFYETGISFKKENTSFTLPSKMSTFTSETSDLTDEVMKKARPMSVISRISTRNSDRQISLPPQVSKSNLNRPPIFDAQGGVVYDELNKTIIAVERKIGQSLREKAIDSLNIASTFKKRAWLHQINLANNLSKNSIRRPALQFS